MHNYIYQMDKYPIAEENYLREDCINEGDMVCIDYSDELNSEEREKAIEYLVEKVLPKGMFTLNPDYSITYNGGIEEWRKTYCEIISTAAKRLTPENVLATFYPKHKLKKAIANPLDISALFVFDNKGVDVIAESSAELLRIVNNMEKGEILYIGGVCDYHF